MTNQYASNAVHAWWQGGCGLIACGKNEYEGAVGHGLWEFPMVPAKTYYFVGTAFIQVHCSNAFGVNCPDP